MIIQSKLTSRCGKCNMLIEPGDWIRISVKGDVLECLFDSLDIREKAREYERNNAIQKDIN